MGERGWGAGMGAAGWRDKGLVAWGMVRVVRGLQSSGDDVLSLSLTSSPLLSALFVHLCVSLSSQTLLSPCPSLLRVSESIPIARSPSDFCVYTNSVCERVPGSWPLPVSLSLSLSLSCVRQPLTGL